MSIDKKEPLFKNPIESNNGLSIDDLNKYLPAVQKVEDLFMTVNEMKDGLFLGLANNGVTKIPNDSIDLIIAEPPELPELPHEEGDMMTMMIGQNSIKIILTANLKSWIQNLKTRCASLAVRERNVLILKRLPR